MRISELTATTANFPEIQPYKLFDSINALFQNGLWSFLVVSALIAVITILIVRITVKNLQKHHVSIFIVHVVKILILSIGILGIALQIVPLQQYAVSLLAGGSVVVVVLGLAAQEATGNIVSGIFIGVFKPFTDGQLIRIPSQGIAGTVEDITLRHTVIKTVENTRVIVPNSVMNTSVVENLHFSDLRHCNFLDVSISYTADIELAKKIMIEEAQNHPSCLDIRTDEEKAEDQPIVGIRCTALGASSVDLRAIIWTKDFGTGALMLSDLRQSVKKRFDEEGVEIPYAYTNVILKKDN